MKTIIDLTGKKFVVTGASSGIGRQIAFTLSEVGAKVILIARREEKLREVMTELEGDGHAYYVADLKVIENIEELFKRIFDEQGKLDGLVYSAGVTCAVPFAQIKPDRIKEVFDVNFFGFFECVRQICKKGRFNEGMRIVGISSTASFSDDKGHIAYSASKAAMNSAIKGIAKEVAKKGICINAIAPGMTNTIMYETTLFRQTNEAWTENLWMDQYLGLIEPEDIANAVTFLLSPAARFITGTILPVSGGLRTY